jgi:hypothetical protein
MKNVITTSLVTVAGTLLPFAAFASGLASNDARGGQVGQFMMGVLAFIDNILIPVILGLAFLMFVWGVFKFFILGGSDEEAQAKGKSLMIYAVAGFVLILSFYGIVNILTNGLGTQNDGLQFRPSTGQSV